MFIFCIRFKYLTYPRFLCMAHSSLLVGPYPFQTPTPSFRLQHSFSLPQEYFSDFSDLVRSPCCRLLWCQLLLLSRNHHTWNFMLIYMTVCACVCVCMCVLQKSLRPLSTEATFILFNVVPQYSSQYPCWRKNLHLTLFKNVKTDFIQYYCSRRESPQVNWAQLQSLQRWLGILEGKNEVIWRGNDQGWSRERKLEKCRKADVRLINLIRASLSANQCDRSQAPTLLQRLGDRNPLCTDDYISRGWLSDSRERQSWVKEHPTHLK